MTEKYFTNLLIKRFIKEHNRAPLDYEINDLLSNLYQSNPDILDVGIYNNYIKSNLNSASSASEFNNLLEDISFNNTYIYKGIAKIIEKYLLLVTNTNIKLDNTKHLINKINNELSNYLIKNNLESNLIISLLEDFTINNKVNNSLTTANVAPKAVTIGNQSIASNLNFKVINWIIVSNQEAVTNQVLDSIENLYVTDNKAFVIECSSQNDIDTYLILDMIIDESSININNITINVMSNINSISLYQEINNNFVLCETKSVVSDAVSFRGSFTANKYRLILRKTKADYTSNDRYSSLYKIDSIQFSYADNNITESDLYLGPYTFYDTNNNIKTFNTVSFDACDNIPENTNIQYFVSVDNEQWLSISPSSRNYGNSVISLLAETNEISLSTVDNDLSEYSVAYQKEANFNLDKTTTILNYKCPIDILNTININDINIYRNIKSSDSIFDQDSRWFFDLEKGIYKTSLIIKDNIIINFGPNTIQINDIAISGNYNFIPGIYNIGVNQNNYFSIDDGITSEKDLINRDPLYPYNHKYILEGYNYSSAFKGNKIYKGFEIVGAKLKYVDYTLFKVSNKLDIFTIINDDNYIYFLVKTMKEYSDYYKERFSVEITSISNTIDTLYCKAILSTTNSNNSPSINSILFKVI